MTLQCRRPPVQAIPFVQIAVGLCTILACAIIVHEKDREFSGGRDAPWISDLASFRPEHFVFGIGFTIVAVLGCVVSFFLYTSLGVFVPIHKRVLRVLQIVSIIFLVFASISFAFLAWFNNEDIPAAHTAFTGIFFACVLIFMLLNLLTWSLTLHFWRKRGPDEEVVSGKGMDGPSWEYVVAHLRTAMVWKTVALAGVVVGLVGLAICSIEAICEEVVNGKKETCIPLQNTQSSFQYVTILFILTGLASLSIELGLPVRGEENAGDEGDQNA
mmetsp:Transcript_34402/g.96997  ORF Transcript_34402/g.96997 Transcript_34402/m.96997 type:complete len:272 (+) Transcript_34402:17-832(+)